MKHLSNFSPVDNFGRGSLPKPPVGLSLTDTILGYIGITLFWLPAAVTVIYLAASYLWSAGCWVLVNRGVVLFAVLFAVAVFIAVIGGLYILKWGCDELHDTRARFLKDLAKEIDNRDN